MEILITRHLTLRPLLEVDADDLYELIAKEPALAVSLPTAFAALLGFHHQTSRFDAAQTLIVIKEKVIGWVSFGETKATAFSSHGDVFRAEALTAAQSYFGKQSGEFIA